MNKRRRYKAKRRKAARLLYERHLRRATFRFWGAQPPRDPAMEALYARLREWP